MKGSSKLDERMKELEKRSSEAGQPVTVQRRAALKALLASSDHPTAETIYEDVITELPGVSKATVYRALDNLVQLGLARKVHHDGSVARFDGNAERHHHLICQGCGKIEDVSWELLDTIPISQMSTEEFEVRDFFVNFQGICRDCATSRRSK